MVAVNVDAVAVAIVDATAVAVVVAIAVAVAIVAATRIVKNRRSRLHSLRCRRTTVVDAS